MNLISTKVKGDVEILIAEDSFTQAEQLKHTLEAQGYRLSIARNGCEALAAAEQHPPALIISDIVMPEMGGYELCRRIKQNEKLREIPVILLTSLSDPADVVRGLESGADNFIFKPYDEPYLLARIAYILANRHLRESDSAQMGVEVLFRGRKFFISSDRLQILNLLLSTYETAVQKNQQLIEAKEELKELNEHLEAKVKERTVALETEIAERKQVQDELRRSEIRYRQLFESNPQPMWVFDLETLAFLAVNAAAIHHYGYSREEFLAITIKDIRPEEDVPALLEHTSRKLENLQQLIWRHRKKDGSIIEVETTSHDLVFDGRAARLVLANDITEKKKLQAQLLRAQRMESIGALAGGIAHDLNNALAPIIMGIELLREESSPEGRAQMLNTMKSSAQHGVEMIKQILTFARGVTGEAGILDIKRVITEIVKLAKETFPRSIEVRSRIVKGLYPVTGNATQLHQVLLNLCVNARDAMPRGGNLQIEAANEVLDRKTTPSKPEPISGPHVVLTVSDTGSGMDPELLSRIFEPFFTTKELGKGTGLGLSTVQGIVKGHGGFIELASEIGKGSIFKVYLPAAMTVEPDSAPMTPIEPPLGRGEKILVVDDENSVLEMTRETLETFQYQVLGARDGAEAVRTYRQHQNEIQAVIVDMMMPIMDGPMTVQELQKIDPRIKIIGVSGLGSESVLVDTGQLRVRAFLKKPYTVQALLTVLRDVLRQAGGESD